MWRMMFVRRLESNAESILNYYRKCNQVEFTGKEEDTISYRRLVQKIQRTQKKCKKMEIKRTQRKKSNHGNTSRNISLLCMGDPGIGKSRF